MVFTTRKPLPWCSWARKSIKGWSDEGFGGDGKGFLIRVHWDQSLPMDRWNTWLKALCMKKYLVEGLAAILCARIGYEICKWDVFLTLKASADRYHKNKTGVSVAGQERLLSSKIIVKYLIRKLITLILFTNWFSSVQVKYEVTINRPRGHLAADS